MHFIIINFTAHTEIKINRQSNQVNKLDEIQINMNCSPGIKINEDNNIADAVKQHLGYIQHIMTLFD